MKTVIPIFLIACLVLPLPLLSYAASAEINDILREAEAAVGEGQLLDAYRAVNKAKELLAPQVPLTVLNSVLVSDDPVGFGAYDPRPDNRFKAGERILVYGEAVGFAIREKDEKHRLSLSFDYVLSGDDNTILAGKRSFGVWEQESWTPLTETFFYVSYEFNGLDSGIYDLETIIHDNISGEQTSVVIPIEIVVSPVDPETAPIEEEKGE